jgi:hypothetical protein
MTPEHRNQLEADARRCGFNDPEPVFALAELECWARDHGFKTQSHASITRRGDRHPSARQLVVAGGRYSYRVRRACDGG